MEIWRDIDGYEGHYQVSSYGNVRSVKKEPYVLKGDYQSNGYKRVYLWKDGRKENRLVHRLVALSFLPNPNGYTDVNHIDEVKSNNNYENLQWCTHIYNMNYGNVRQKISNANKGRKLTEYHRKMCAISALGKKWMNNNEKEILVKKDDVPSFLNSGWTKGRLKRA